MRFAARARQEDDDSDWSGAVLSLFFFSLFVGVPVLGSIKSFMEGDWIQGGLGLAGFLLVCTMVTAMLRI